jgi:hypothetical protein
LGDWEAHSPLVALFAVEISGEIANQEKDPIDANGSDE